MSDEHEKTSKILEAIGSLTVIIVVLCACKAIVDLIRNHCSL